MAHWKKIVRAGALGVSVLAIYSNGASLNPDEGHVFR